MSIRDEDALLYHSSGRPGKLEIRPTKPFTTARDLSLAYTPGVAAPVRRIAEDESASHTYTQRGNLVAVITNGTAVLGLGNVGPAAAKPVMEGKAVLFKRFADIDCFDIEVAANDVDTFCRVVEALEPTFGGVNLEDIRAPEAFDIEARLSRSLSIPVFHDDQHGTAIICGAAFLNALEIAGKPIGDVRVVFSGAGAAAIACANMLVSLGVRTEHVLLVDSRGVIYEGREEGMNRYKAPFARPTSARTLADAVDGADAFIGVSVAGALTPAMLETMAVNPIVFAMANPDPEIPYDVAVATRPDAIVATGRSDFPNQVNNVLGFPYVFRGALDVRARGVTEEMKKAAVVALAHLAKEDVPPHVSAAYGNQPFTFGRNYFIPKPFDPRVLLWVAPAVAKAAMDSGVARIPIHDMERYKARLSTLFHPSLGIMRRIVAKARSHPKRIVFPEAEDSRVLKACEIVHAEGIAEPILLGDPERIRHLMEVERIQLDGVAIVQPRDSKHYQAYCDAYWRRRSRKGVTRVVAERTMRSRVPFGLMMVAEGDADGLVAGMTMNYPEVLRPALEIIGPVPGPGRVCGMYMVLQRGQLHFFADTTVNVDPDAETLAGIAVSVADTVRRMDVEPHIAMLSFSNFGSAPHAQTHKVAEATRLVRSRRPDIEIDGEMQVDAALDAAMRADTFPFCELSESANVLIFPDLNSGNIGYKLVHHLGQAEIVGPVLIGMDKPVNVLQRNTDINSVVHLTALTVVKAQGGNTF